LHWLDGEGWLVLLGGGRWERGETDLVDAQVLSIANLDRPMVILLSEGEQETAQALLEHYTLLGGPGGEAFVLSEVTCHSEVTRHFFQSSDFLSLIAEAGIFYMGGENPQRLVRSLWNTPALEQIVRSFSTLQGLLLIGAGGGATSLGTWLVDVVPDGHISRGLGFLANAVVVPHFTKTEEAVALQQTLKAYPGHLGLGLPDGTALALGPQGQVETWGTDEVTAVVHM